LKWLLDGPCVFDKLKKNRSTFWLKSFPCLFSEPIERQKGQGIHVQEDAAMLGRMQNDQKKVIVFEVLGIDPINILVCISNMFCEYLLK
jgi:hypothetical protein